jgi:hypothetical protein
MTTLTGDCQHSPIADIRSNILNKYKLLSLPKRGIDRVQISHKRLSLFIHSDRVYRLSNIIVVIVIIGKQDTGSVLNRTHSVLVTNCINIVRV